MLCKSGRHDWISAADAAKCCNGWRRVVVIGEELLPGDHVVSRLPGDVSCGYRWVPLAEGVSESCIEVRVSIATGALQGKE